MIKTFDYADVPAGFDHCFNSHCKKADSCLRFQITPFVPDSKISVSIINPKVAQPDGDCPKYLTDNPYKVAFGFTHLLDELPYNTACAIKKAMKEYLGHNRYYRIFRKERFFTPQDQEYVKSLFVQYGVTKEPQFDSFESSFNWTEQL